MVIDTLALGAHPRRSAVSGWGFAAATAVAVGLADQGTKLWAERAQDGAVALAHNPAAALGVVQGSAAGLIAITLVVLAMFALVIIPISQRFEIPTWIPALVIGGGLANTLDRARFGTVRDFIQTPWAIVNVADLCVVAGVVLLSVLGLMRLAQTRSTAEYDRAPKAFEAG